MIVAQAHISLMTRLVKPHQSSALDPLREVYSPLPLPRLPAEMVVPKFLLDVTLTLHVLFQACGEFYIKFHNKVPWDLSKQF